MPVEHKNFSRIRRSSRKLLQNSLCHASTSSINPSDKEIMRATACSVISVV
jgi:hypothetical protein